MVDRIVSSWIHTEMERKERADSEIYGIKSERVVFTSALYCSSDTAKTLWHTILQRNLRL